MLPCPRPSQVVVIATVLAWTGVVLALWLAAVLRAHAGCWRPDGPGMPRRNEGRVLGWWVALAVFVTKHSPEAGKRGFMSAHNPARGADVRADLFVACTAGSSTGSWELRSINYINQNGR